MTLTAYTHRVIVFEKFDQSEALTIKIIHDVSSIKECKETVEFYKNDPVTVKMVVQTIESDELDSITI